MFIFADIFQFQTKSRIKAGEGLEEGKYPFFTSSGKQTKHLNEFLFEGDSLIFGTGGNASVHYIDTKFAASTDCLVVQPKNRSKTITKYYYYYFRGHIYILEKGFKGAGLKHISKEYISRIKLPDADVNHQRRIVEILDHVYSLILKRKESIKLLDDFLRSTFLEMFGDPVHGERWKRQPLETVADVYRGRFSPRPRNDPSYYNGDFPFIQTGDISNSKYRLSKYTQTLNERGIKVSKCLPKGTIAIAIVGATIGATTILEIDAYAPDSVVGITVDEKKVSNRYVEYVLRFYKPIFIARAPETARANINLNTLCPLLLQIPPLDLQNKFASIVNQVESTKQKMQGSLEQMDSCFNSLMQKYFG